jgi:multiple sugar transport system permease protein
VIRRREARAGVLFVLPWLLGLLIFTAYPVIATFYLSFTDYNIIQPPHLIGLQNYGTMFTADTDFWTGVANSGYYALISVPLGLVVALLLALVLNLRARGVGIYRTLFYLPALAPPVVGTIVFMMLLDPDAGLVNVLLRGVGLPAPGWFTDPAWAKPALILLSLWGSGTAAIIFLAGLQEIPQSLLEAAMIDGAGPLQRFWNVTVPLLSPVILFNLVMGVIGSFQVFTQAWVVNGGSGAPAYSSMFYVLYLFVNAFRRYRMGTAAAQAWLLFIVILVLTILFLWASRRFVYYEDEGGGRF